MAYDYGYSCSWEQVFSPSVSFDAVSWRTDLLLPQPQLAFPRPDAVVCLDTTPGNGSNILLQWNTSAGATHYLVQWGGNAQLSGPDTREVLVTATQYELLTDDDIRLGETCYWRVQAQNRTTGGVSAQSEIRAITLECDNSTSNVGKGLNRCTDYDFDAKIKGGDMMSCCDEQVYWLEMTFSHKDQFDRTLVDVREIVWEVSGSPSGGVSPYLSEANSSDYKIILETCGDDESESQVVELKATITFDDFVQGDTFECEVTKKIFVDCDTPFHERPWSGAGGSDYCYPICLDYDYSYPEALGYMYNPGVVLNYDPAYAQFVTATGPVFRIPACNGIYTYCCECVPTTLNLSAGDGTTTITHDSDKGSWYANELLPWQGCSEMIGPSEMYCSYDGENHDWYFLTNVACRECVDTSLCSCVPDQFDLTLGFNVAGAVPSSGSKTVSFTHQGGDLWSGTLSFTPAGCQRLDATIELNFDGPADADLIPGDILNWTSDSSGFALSGCDPTSVTFSLDSVNAGCGTTVTISASGLSVEQCDPCVAPLTLGTLFYPLTCDPFYASFSLQHEDLSEDLQVLITDTDIGCDCSDSATGGGACLLEARVNIPLSCHFKLENGLLALNLENLIGPGLAVNDEYSPDCPYIYATGEAGGPCYNYHTVYCCYTVYEVPSYSGGMGGTVSTESMSRSSGSSDIIYFYESFNYEFNYEFQ